MNKKILPSFYPPRLVVGDSRTYILVYASDLFGKMKRFRPTFNLNRIKDSSEKLNRGHDLKEKIMWWLEQGFLFENFDEHKVIKGIKLNPEVILAHPNESKPILPTFDIAEEILCLKFKYHTNRSYRSSINEFRKYILKKELNGMTAGKVDAVLAIEYLDYRRYDSKISNTTYNNNLRNMRRVWSELNARGFNSKNPFGEIKYLKEEKKKRRDFTDLESKIVLNYAYHNRRDLFYFLILQYACAIRPAEQRRIRFSHFHFDNGIIAIDEAVAKTNKARSIAIPKKIRWIFEEEFWHSSPSHFYVFGKGYKPHPTVQMNHNTFGKIHSNLLKDLQAKNILGDITGLQLYSWKDSGLTDLIEDQGLVAAMDHAGHSDPKVTLRYRHKKKINEKTKSFTSTKMADLGKYKPTEVND